MIKIKILSILLFFSLNTFSQLNDSIIEAISNNFNIWNYDKIPEKYQLHFPVKNDNPDYVLSIWVNSLSVDSEPNHLTLPKLSRYKNIAFLNYTDNAVLDKRFDFSWFPNLREVIFKPSINQNQVNQLFSTAKKIRYLEVNINDTIPNCFCELNELKTLIIYGSPIFPSCIKEMKNLKFINLIGGGENFETKIFDMPHLEALSLETGPLEIPTSVKNMKYLKALRINAGGLILLPPEFGELDSLENLDLFVHEGKIVFPTEFNKLSNLRNLYFRSDTINEFPNISNLDKMLYLWYIAKYTYKYNLDFSKTPNLNFIWLQTPTKHKVLPNGICTLKDLRALFINHYIDKLPPDFFLLPNLGCLSLNGNLSFNQILSLAQMPRMYNLKPPRTLTEGEKKILMKLKKDPTKSKYGGDDGISYGGEARREGGFANGLNSLKYYETLYMHGLKLERNYK
jgi:hypothetical protein